MLVVYDEEKSKKKYFICLTEEAANTVISKFSEPLSSDGLDETDNNNLAQSARKKQDQNDISNRFHQVNTEEAIKEESVTLNRDLVRSDDVVHLLTTSQLRISISRKRREFGGPFRFTDSDAHDGLVECRQFKNPNFDLIRLQKDVGTQVRHNSNNAIHHVFSQLPLQRTKLCKQCGLVM